MVREPLADVYYVESWKQWNFENTDHNIHEIRHDNESALGQNFV